MKNKNDFSPFLELFSQLYETLPVGLIVSEPTSCRILYRNAFVRALLPGIRKGASLSRYLGFSPCVKKLCLAELFEKVFLVSCDEVVLQSQTFSIVLLQNGSRLLVQEFSDLLASYSDDLISLASQMDDISFTRANAVRKNYADALLKNLNALAECNRFLYTTLSGIRQVRPGRVFACSCKQLLSCLQKELSPVYASYGITVSTDCPPGITLLVNFRDFVFAALNILNFAFVFAFSKTIHLTVTEQDDFALFTFSFPDSYGVLDLYRNMVRDSTLASGRNGAEKIAGLFFPLSLALQTLAAYRHEVHVWNENGLFSVSIRIKTTLELPELIVRSFEEEGPLSSLCSAFLLPSSLLRRLQTRLDSSPIQDLSPLQFSFPFESDLL